MMDPLKLAFGGGSARTRLVISPSIQKLCFRPYEGHPKGCPNYGQNEGCPPKARLINKVLDLKTKDLWVVWNIFALGAHVAEMKKRHPEWSKRQCRCVRYWQGTARKQLRDRVRQLLLKQGAKAVDLAVLYRPEAHGVNVTATMAKHGIELPWPPEDYAILVAVVGREREDA